MADPFAPLRAAYEQALVQKKKERTSSAAYVRSFAREHPELAHVAERVLGLLNR